MQDPNIGGVLQLAQPRVNMFNSSAHVVNHTGLMDPTNATRLQEAHSTTRHQMSMINEASDTDKRAIYKHPLFPLMALLFERCEQVTQTPDYPLVSTLKSDIQSFVRHYQQRLHDFEQSIGERPEVDTLMIKAIQILWIHLLELDKVNELCKDFCTRYIACLRTKLQNEQLLHIDAFESDFGAGDMMGNQPHVGHMQMNMPQMGSLNSNGVRDYDDVGHRRQSRHSSGEDKGTYNNCMPLINPNLQTPNSAFNYPIQELVMHEHNRKMMNSAYPPVDYGQQRSSAGQGEYTQHLNVPEHLPHNNSNLLNSFSPSNDSQDEFEENEETEFKEKKYAMPKHSQKILKNWLFQHIGHPYPTEDEKKKIADDANLSINQINNWFTNARHKLSKEDCGNNVRMIENEGMSRSEGNRMKFESDKNKNNSGSSTPTSTIYDGDNSLGEFTTINGKARTNMNFEEEKDIIKPPIGNHQNYEHLDRDGDNNLPHNEKNSQVNKTINGEEISNKIDKENLNDNDDYHTDEES